MNNPIYKVDESSIVTYEVVGESREDDYGSWLPPSTELKNFHPNKKDYGVYTVIDNKVLRFTPAMTLIGGYKHKHDIKVIVKATKVGTIGLGTLEFEHGTEYDSQQKHYSELKPLDKFRFVERFSFSETFTLRLKDREYILNPKDEFIFLSSGQLGFKISDLNGKIYNVNYWNGDIFVYITGKAQFK